MTGPPGKDLILCDGCSDVRGAIGDHDWKSGWHSLFDNKGDYWDFCPICKHGKQSKDCQVHNKDYS